MGLYVSYYNKLGERVESPLITQCSDPYEVYLHLHVNKHFVGHADGILGGFYHADPSHYDNVLGFSAGSYGTYNGWRDELAELLDHPSIIDKNAFHELIMFSDCEGTIGPITSEKLANDFKNYLPHIISNKTDDLYFIQKYIEWMVAFTVASGDGVVVFG